MFMHNRNSRRSFPSTKDLFRRSRDLLQARQGSRVAALLSSRVDQKNILISLWVPRKHGTRLKLKGLGIDGRAPSEVLLLAVVLIVAGIGHLLRCFVPHLSVNDNEPRLKSFGGLF